MIVVSLLFIYCQAEPAVIIKFVIVIKHWGFVGELIIGNSKKL